MGRDSARFVPYKDRKAVVAGLKNICPASSAEPAARALEESAGAWDTKRPMISNPRRNRWNEAIPFFYKLPPEIRKAVYAANAIER
jgi:transposase-like protein